MYRYIMVFVRKNKKLLAFAIFSFFSVESFANKVETGENLVEQEREDIASIQNDLEEIDKQGAPKYSSGIFFSLPVSIGFNISPDYGTKSRNVELGILSSQNIDVSFFANFPLFMPHIYVSAGIEVGTNSLFWNGYKKFDIIKLFSDKTNEEVLDIMYEKAVDSTKVGCWKSGIRGKLTCFFDKFDPRDGFYMSLGGGLGVQFLESYETNCKESYNGVMLRVSKNNGLIGINRFYRFIGLEWGYQRMAIFFKVYFTPFFNIDKIPLERKWHYAGSFGLCFDLL